VFAKRLYYYYTNIGAKLVRVFAEQVFVATMSPTSRPPSDFVGRLSMPTNSRTIDPDTATMRRRRLLALAQLMDNAFEIPGLKLRIGLDSIIGLIPAAGDAIGAAVSLYIVWEAAKLGATKKQLGIMVGNIALDTLVGSVPGLGDVFDIAFKANMRNLAIMGIVPSAKRSV